MTQNIIITASEIQQGDRISVATQSAFADRTVSYTGVAQKANGPVWRTASGLNLYAHEYGAVIELLDRPIPKADVPTRNKAIVTYNVASFDPGNPQRIAHRNGSGKWTAYDAKGERMDTHFSDEEFGRFLAAGSYSHEIVFAGVAE